MLIEKSDITFVKFIVTVNVSTSIVLHMQIVFALEAITSRVCFLNDHRKVIDRHNSSTFHHFKTLMNSDHQMYGIS